MGFKIPLLVKKTIEVLEKNNHQCYVVGGAVRDLLMDITTYDWDFTTSAKPEFLQKIFPESFYDNVFGTIGITAKDLVKQFNLKDYDYVQEDIKPHDIFEITTFRSDIGYSDRRHPDKVIWGKTLEDDLKRRDFTINAMALRIKNLPARHRLLPKVIAGGELRIKNFDVEIIDPYQGQEDIRNKLIRCVGDAGKRFSEDALRMMRAIRIAALLGFSIEENTLKAIIKNASLINQISTERIKLELFKILKSDFPADGIKILFSSVLLQYILPELIKTRDIEQAGHHTKDVWNHSLDSLASCATKDPLVRLAALLHDVGKPIARRIINGKITFYGHEVVGARIVKNIAYRLKFSKKEIEKLWLLVRYHMFAYDSNMTDKAIRRFILKVGKENINDMMMVRVADRQGGGSKATSWRLRELQERIGKLMYTPLQVSDLKINGNDVMKILNLKPGPKIGEILNKLFDEVMENDKKNEREYLLARIKQQNKINQLNRK